MLFLRDALGSIPEVAVLGNMGQVLSHAHLAVAYRLARSARG